jgi:hypothetical protein
MKRCKPTASDLVKRFEKNVELARKIANDIAEDIDCGESRNTLRMAVSYFADLANAEAIKRDQAETAIRLFKMAKELMDSALK